jgi:hypothetical protein
MWTSGIAIRPVPPFAVVDARTIARVREKLTPDDDDDEQITERHLDDAFARFEASQPALSARLEDALERRSLDETARMLGYFLGVSVWLAFDQQFGNRLLRVDETAIRATCDALDLETELRAERTADALEVDDVVAREQPALMEFVRDHLDIALASEKAHSTSDDPDVGDVYAIYLLVIVEILTLSHAVSPHPGAPVRRGELLA